MIEEKEVTYAEEEDVSLTIYRMSEAFNRLMGNYGIAWGTICTSENRLKKAIEGLAIYIIRYWVLVYLYEHTGLDNNLLEKYKDRLDYYISDISELKLNKKKTKNIVRDVFKKYSGPSTVERIFLSCDLRKDYYNFETDILKPYDYFDVFQYKDIIKEASEAFQENIDVLIEKI